MVQELLIVELRTSLEFVFPVKEQEISILEQYNEVIGLSLKVKIYK